MFTELGLDDVLARQPRTAAQRKALPHIGEMMVARGLVTNEQVALALESQRTSGRLMGEILVEMGALTSFQVAEIAAERMGVPFVDLRQHAPDPAVALRFPEDVARRYRAIPITEHDDCLVVAIANTRNVFALDDLRLYSRQLITPVMADGEQIDGALDRIYNHSDIRSSVEEAADDSDHQPEVQTRDESGDAPIVRLVNALLERAVDERASDIHIEPMSNRVRVRLRVDGVLHDASDIPTSVLRPIVSRMKVLAGIDITRRRTPQDGRFSTTVKGRTVDVRVATLPTAHGEAVVLRLLDQMQTVLDLSSLGMSKSDFANYERAFRAPQGAVITSGPTGSGKTSTLYATLAALAATDRSIISIEDPIEYRFDGVKQLQVDVKAGLTFATALRSCLRADPDVILVGEIRDAETVRIAAEASITGHLVFSTLHANRAAAVPMRLIDMGAEPYLVASALTCVVAQRLVRVLCDRCAVPDESHDTLLRDLGCDDEDLAHAHVRRAVGCASCRGTGYEGRRAVYEVMPVTEEIARLIMGRASSQELERRAVAEGMDSLRTAALREVLSGNLTAEEMLRIITR